MSSQTVFYSRNNDGLSIYIDGVQKTVASTHSNYSKILDALRAKEYDKLLDLIDIPASINKTGVSRLDPGCKVFVKDGEVFFKDTRNHRDVLLDGSLVDRILRSLGTPAAQKYADALMMLMHNIQLNPVKDISSELYEWLMSGQSPITSDGCVLAYKKVRKDYLDIYTGKMDNSVGQCVKMRQSDVDTNRLNECSVGLHFASLDYLSHYGSSSNDYNDRIMIVKVNPRHIFAIPRDYKCQKGRASEYLVVGEYTGDPTIEAFKDSFVDEDSYQESAPEVKFGPKSLMSGLKNRAIAAGYVSDDGLDLVRVELRSDRKIVRILKFSESAGTTRAFETKSVRALLKEMLG